MGLNIFLWMISGALLVWALYLYIPMMQEKRKRKLYKDEISQKEKRDKWFEQQRQGKMAQIDKADDELRKQSPW